MITRRIILIPFLWFFIIGGVMTFLGHRAVRHHDEHEDKTPIVSRDLDIELLATFDTGTDPFAMSGDSQESLKVSLNGRSLVLKQSALMAGQPLHLTVKQDLLVGGNEIFVSAVPSAALQAAALRVRLSGGQVSLEKTLWADQGGRVAGEVNFEVRQ